MRNVITSSGTLRVAKTIVVEEVECPGPIRTVAQSIRPLEPEEILEILDSDDVARENIRDWCKRIGYEYIGEYEVENGLACYVRKK